MTNVTPQFKRRVYLDPDPEEESRFFAELGKLVPRSKNVKDIQFRPGEDSTGYPALWITILSNEDNNPSDEDMRELNRAARTLSDAVHESGYDRWPYVRIKTE